MHIAHESSEPSAFHPLRENGALLAIAVVAAIVVERKFVIKFLGSSKVAPPPPHVGRNRPLFCFRCADLWCRIQILTPPIAILHFHGHYHLHLTTSKIWVRRTLRRARPSASSRRWRGSLRCVVQCLLLADPDSEQKDKGSEPTLNEAPRPSNASRPLNASRPSRPESSKPASGDNLAESMDALNLGNAGPPGRRPLGPRTQYPAGPQYDPQAAPPPPQP